MGTVLNQFEAIVVGVSAGGLKALRTILSQLNSSLAVPIIIVQHRQDSPDNYLITYLDDRCVYQVKEVEEKERIEAGAVYIAPANYHILVEKNRTFSLSVDEAVCFARPSIDVLFETAAAAYKNRLIGIILTGANSDGSNGIEKIKKAGGLTIAQDPESAESPFMPQAAIDSNSIDFIVELEEIPNFLQELLEEKHDIK